MDKKMDNRDNHIMMKQDTYYPLRPFTTLLKKEILRFLSVSSQTLLAPIITAGLYLLIFGVSLGARVSISENFSYLEFVIPGLIMMGVINNAFANSSSSLFMSRYLGNIIEFLVTPLGPHSYVWAYTLAAMLRSLLVGLVIWVVTIFFTGLPWVYPIEAIILALLASFIFAQFGLIAALYATSFDTLSMFTNFLILPLIYLGGLFYPASLLPEPWSLIAKFNPLYFLIGGFRQAILGQGDVSISTAIIFSFMIALIVYFLNLHSFKVAKRLRN
jgi:ABC-2 type transport system permease protein